MSPTTDSVAPDGDGFVAVEVCGCGLVEELDGWYGHDIVGPVLGPDGDSVSSEDLEVEEVEVVREVVDIVVAVEPVIVGRVVPVVEV